MNWSRGRLRIAAVLLLLSGAGAQAQSYPTHPITLVAPFPPGASTDFIARLIREPLADALGQSVIIENRPGAGGTTGTAAVANAAPDGHTLLVTVNAPVTMYVYLQKNFPFDPKTALAPITTAADVVLVLAVHSSVPVKTVSELIEYARQNRDKKLSYGSAGIGPAHHTAGELLKKKPGIDMLHVPYRGGAPAIQDLVAGHIPISFGTTPAVLPQAAAGSIRIVALAEAKRSPDMPDVPTIAETVPGVVTATWVGLFAPAGTPKAIIDRLNRIVVEALKRPDIIEKLRQQGAIAVAGTPEELGERVRTELARWGRIIPSIGLVPEQPWSSTPIRPLSWLVAPAPTALRRWPACGQRAPRSSPAWRRAAAAPRSTALRCSTPWRKPWRRAAPARPRSTRRPPACAMPSSNVRRPASASPWWRQSSCLCTTRCTRWRARAKRTCGSSGPIRWALPSRERSLPARSRPSSRAPVRSRCSGAAARSQPPRHGCLRRAASGRAWWRILAAIRCAAAIRTNTSKSPPPTWPPRSSCSSARSAAPRNTPCSGRSARSTSRWSPWWSVATRRAAAAWATPAH